MKANLCMIKTTTHNDDLFNDGFNKSRLTTAPNDNTADFEDLKEIEAMVRTIKFQPSDSKLLGILAYASSY